MVFSYSNRKNSSYATTTISKTGVDLEVVFFVGLQSTLLKTHGKSLGLLKIYAIMMRRLRCSSVEIIDKRLRCGHDVEMVMTWRCLNDQMSKMRFIGHVPRSYDWSYAEVMWLIGLVTMLLQLLSFLDTNSVESVIVCWGKILNENPIKNPPTNKLDWGRKSEDQWEHPHLVGKLMSLKVLWRRLWKTFQTNNKRLRRTINDCWEWEGRQWKAF